MAVKKATETAKTTETTKAAEATKAAETTKVAETAVKEDVKTTAKTATKAPAKKATAAKKAPAKKTPAKKTPVKKETAAKTTTRRTATKVNTEVFIQFAGYEVSEEELITRIKEKWEIDGNKVSAIKTLSLYVKPEEYKVYYVINGSFADALDI